MKKGSAGVKEQEKTAFVYVDSSGGLISDRKDILSAFNAGADAISTTKEELWLT